jgi:hypothetical protein
MTAEGSSPPTTPAPTQTPKRDARAPRARRTRTLLTLVVIALLAIPVGWLSYAYLSGAEPAPDSEDALALSILGGWWNIEGSRHLVLEWEGRRATLHDFAKSDAGVASIGSWRTTQATVIVHVRGAAGELTQELELVGNDVEMFLAPAPSKQARLIDCWIADHEDHDEDMSPPDSTAREARAAPVTHATFMPVDQ